MWHKNVSYYLFKMFLVSGGYNGTNELDSTEIYDPDLGTWKTGGPLPSPRRYLRATSIGNRLLFFGKIYYQKMFRKGKSNKIIKGGAFGVEDNDTILEYNVSDDSFTKIATMAQARHAHAISVVQYKDFSKKCENFEGEQKFVWVELS